MHLTDTHCRNSKPRERPYKVMDERGLYLLVKPNGSKLWRMRYTFQGREGLASFGLYPDVPLALARERRDEARRQLAQGINPTAARKAARLTQAGTFELVARELMEGKRKTLAQRTFKRDMAILEQWMFPYLGKRSLALIEAPELLEALKRIEKHGHNVTAHAARALAGQVFRYGVGTSRCKHDVSAALRHALAPVDKVSHPTLLEPAKIGGLLRAMRAYEGSPIIWAALNLMPYVFLRPDELRQAVWSEFEGLGTKEPLWRIPAPRMKLRRMHLVPLSRQAVHILRDLQPLTGGDADAYVFQSLISRLRPIGESTLNSTLRRIGYTKDEQTPHGFRHMASTLLNEMTRFNGDWIEVQLAHAPGGVRGIYNHAEYLPQRRRMMQAWADHLDKLRAGKPKDV